MSSYDYYRSQYPDWGQSYLQFRSPPAPTYRPLPTWSGWDYYRSHALYPDHNLYYTVMNRTREFGPTGGTTMREALVWQRKVYSGLVNLTQLLPVDIGAAAAYEAYRLWKHHNRLLFEPLGGAVEREKEAMVGIAIAEASRLWQHAGRPMDTFGLRDCLESAALTAAQIAYTVLEDGGSDYSYDRSYRPRRRSRRYSDAPPLVLRSTQPGVAVQPSLAATPFRDSIPIPGRAASAGYGGGGSPYMGNTAAIPFPGTGSSPYGAQLEPAGNMAYGSQPYPGLSTSYGGGYGGGLSGPGAMQTGVNMTPPGMGAAGVGPMGAGNAMGGGYGGTGPVGANGPIGTADAPMGGMGGGLTGGMAGMGGLGGTGASYPYPTAGYGAADPYSNAAMGTAGAGANMPGAGIYGAAGSSYGYQNQQPQVGYQSQPFAGSGPPGATIVAGQTAIPAQAGSTIYVDTGARARRNSHSGHRHGHRRSGSADRATARARF